MPVRNLVVILVSAVVSLICYEKTQRNRYAVTFSEAMHIIEQYYVDEVDSRILFEGAMDGMMDRLDEHSAYYSPDRLPRFQEDLDQEFAGVGHHCGNGSGIKDAHGGLPVCRSTGGGKPAFAKATRFSASTER